MNELKIQHILTLAYLLSKGARNNFVTITTFELGKKINKAQQSASKHILELEEGQFIERIINGRNISIKVTPRGYQEISKLLSVLQKSQSTNSSCVKLEGKLVSGMGEGAYYMALQGYTKQFKSKIGYIPFPGTLNIKLDKKIYQNAIRQFEGYKGVKINGFADKKRTYGWVKCFAGTVNDSIKCELIIPERTHHDDSIIELISKFCIREAGNLKDGSKVSININLERNLLQDMDFQ